MKKILLLTVVLMLGTIAMWAQASNEHVFTVKPMANSGTFEMYLNAVNSTSSNPVDIFIDWGNGTKIVYTLRGSTLISGSIITSPSLPTREGADYR